MQTYLEGFKKQLQEMEQKLEIEIDGRASVEELQKLRNNIQEIKKEIDKFQKK